MKKRRSIEVFAKKERSAKEIARTLDASNNASNAAIVEAAVALVESDRGHFQYIDSTLRITLWKNPKTEKRVVIPVV